MRLVDQHRPRRLGAYRRVAALATAALLTCTTSLAPAQSSSAADRALPAKLLARGFTKADFADFTLTKVMPHFNFYSRWQRCATGAVGIAVANAGDRNSARQLGKQLCTEDADYVSASLGQSIGVVRSARVRKLLDAIFDEAVQARWSELQAQEQKPLRRPVTVPVQIGRWKIKPSPGGCMAEYQPASGGPPRVALIQDGKFVQLWIISGNEAIDPRRTPPVRYLTIKGRSGTEEFFRVFQEGIAGDTRWLRTGLSDDLAKALADAREIVIEDRTARAGSMAAVAEHFIIEPVEPVLPTVQQC